MLFLLSLLSAAQVSVAPGEDWCSIANSSAAGDEILLQAGEHAGPCVLSAPGITLRGEDPQNPPMIRYNGSSSNVIDVTVDSISLVALSFGPTQPDIDAIKIKAGSHITVEDCTFTEVGGIGVSANSTNSDGLIIRHNRFLSSKATPLYLGCHDGLSSCTSTNLRIEGNLIDGVTSNSVGYGLEVKKDSYGVVRDNVIHDTQGPGIEIFGSEDPSRATVVDGNFVVRSRNNASIEAGGPYVTVTNNLVVGGGDGGIYVYPYWESVHDVVVAGNTLVGETATALRLASSATNVHIFNNLAFQQDGSNPFPASLGEADHNVVCGSMAACWVDGENWDFSPVEGIAKGTEDPLLTQDFCGILRDAPPSVGALEEGLGPLSITFKEEFSCRPSEDTGDTADTSDTSGDPPGKTPGSCGCSASSTPKGAWLLAGLLLLLRRRT